MSKINKTFEDWKSYYDSRGISNDIKQKLLKYVEILLNNKVPVIFNFEHLCNLLGRNPNYLASVVNSPESYYRQFKIKKRSGGFRIISSPYPSLLEMQYWIYENILKKIEISNAAHGFTFKKSIITNSKNHTGQKQLLKLDLVDFFTTININRIIYIFKQLGYPNIIAYYLASICCYNKSLPQGAPTSPILSNIVSRKLDKRLVKFSKTMFIKYSRYADDLTFSGDKIPAKFITYITNIVEDEGFEVNEKKTRLYQNKSKRIVTGISVVGNDIRLPRDYKRKLKQELYFIEKYGLYSHISKKRIKKSNYLYSLIGKVNFWISVEPSNEQARKAKIMLNQYLD